MWTARIDFSFHPSLPLIIFSYTPHFLVSSLITSSSSAHPFPVFFFSYFTFLLDYLIAIFLSSKPTRSILFLVFPAVSPLLSNSLLYVRPQFYVISRVKITFVINPLRIVKRLFSVIQCCLTVSASPYNKRENNIIPLIVSTKYKYTEKLPLIFLGKR